MLLIYIIQTCKEFPSYILLIIFYQISNFLFILFLQLIMWYPSIHLCFKAFCVLKCPCFHVYDHYIRH
jgi:hypothetical protein